MSKQLLELLFKDKIINQNQYDEAQAQGKAGKNVIKFLLDHHYIAENKVLFFLSQRFNLSTVNLAKFQIRPEVLKLVTPDLAKKNQLIPIQANQGTLVVVVADPADISRFEDVRFHTKMSVEVVLTSFSAFDQAMQKYYGGSAFASKAIESFKKESKRAASAGEVASTAGAGLELVEVHEIDSDVSASDAPIIQLVNGLLSESINRRASDIHLEPYEKRVRCRMRIDGVLQEVVEIPLEMKRAVIARVKIMARMDIAETRVPQDGRIKLKFAGEEVDFRVNSLPTLFGEKIVMRSLNKGNIQLDIAKLGFDTRQFDLFKKGIYSPTGMVLVTGPTGSGKTTTLYSAITALNQISDNISTAEDPVEYNLEGINQVQVHKEVGLNFAAILRSLLRQDPDIVLVGEIRDYETAEVAIQAALTGHIVLSTLHTNDAPSTVTRLVNMGIEPFLVVAALNTIIAQRLIRRVCEKCKAPQSVPSERLLEIGIPADKIGSFQIFKGKGCNECGKTGYRGRLAIYEVLDFSSTLKEMVLKGETMIELKRQAVREGMKTLRQSAIDRVVDGRTSLEEALSSTMEG